jgi:hypothetical protein
MSVTKTPTWLSVSPNDMRTSCAVIPAEAGIQAVLLDAGLHRHDEVRLGRFCVLAG